ncbi:MAG: hypothetical protein GX417_07285 [Clostridiales bacterium]|nr:hypothetical protein [Clostridiales bacterium]
MSVKLGVKLPISPPIQKLDFNPALLVPGNPNSGGPSAPRAPARSDSEVLSGFIDEMYGTFAPQEVTYDAKSEDEIRASVATWLRPGYDRAIVSRQEQTLTNKANLDADAIARGMGASTYVTDVKNRQQNAEARDIAALESDYGAALAKYVSEGTESENSRKLEAEEFNAGQRQSAYDLAYNAALQLFAQYKKKPGGSGGASKEAATSSRESCEKFLNLLSDEERKEVYDASTKEGAQYRAELVASVGVTGYIELMGMYPATQ